LVVGGGRCLLRRYVLRRRIPGGRLLAGARLTPGAAASRLLGRSAPTALGLCLFLLGLLEQLALFDHLRLAPLLVLFGLLQLLRALLLVLDLLHVGARELRL